MDNESQVLVLITREDIIESHLDKLEGLGINPQHILIDGDILGYYASQGIQTVIHCADNLNCLWGVSRWQKHWASERWLPTCLLWKKKSPILGKQIEQTSIDADLL